MRQIIYEVAAGIGQHADMRHVQGLGRAVGDLIWTCVPSRRAVAVQSIQERLEIGRDHAMQIARSSFQHNGRSFLEIFLARKVDWRFVHDRVSIQDPRRLQELLAMLAKRACVIVTGHLGAWELMGGLLHLLALHKHKQVVVKATHDQALHNIIKRLRSHPTVHFVEHEQAAPKVLRNLKKKGLTAFLVDHNCRREEAVFLPFLGLPAAVNIGPALLALRGKAMVWPAFLIRKGDGAYHLQFEEPLDTEELKGDRGEKTYAIARFYTQAVERQVREHPEQWFWMHRRWKTRPE